MAFTATFVDTTTFTVVTDLTAEFMEGRRVKANCGGDGIKYGTIESSSYGAPDTTVVLDPASDDLTSNLVSVEYGIIGKGSNQSMPEHNHSGDEGSGGQVGDFPFVDFDIAASKPSHKEGRVFWDSVNHTVAQYNDESEITQQLGQELYVKVYNDLASPIPNGTLLYAAFGTAGFVITRPAIATSLASMTGVAIATHEIDPTSPGWVTTTGVVGGLDLSEYSDGTFLYVSDSTAGTFTDIAPKWPSIPHVIGLVVDNDSVDGKILVSSQAVTRELVTLSYTLPLSGVTDIIVPLTGTFRPVGLAETGDVGTDWSLSNQHMFMYINSITGEGDVTITGASLSESTAVPIVGDTEVISVDSTAGVYYQTDKKWWEIVNIDIPAGISAINYDYGVVGYVDLGNTNFRLAGYRCDAFAGGNDPDFTLIINKVQDDGGKKMSIVPIESIGIDSGTAGDQVIDNIRTGAEDRSFDPAGGDLWLNNTVFTFKQNDFNTYFTNDENQFTSRTLHEGYYIRIEGAPAGTGITNVDYVVLQITFELLP